MIRLSSFLSLCLLPLLANGAELLLVGNKTDNTVSVIDRATGVTVNTLPTGEGPHEIAVSGTTAVVTNYGRKADGNTLTIIDLAKGAVVDTMDLGRHSAPHGIEFFSDGKRAAVTTEGSGMLLIVDIPKREIIAAIETRQAISHMVALSPDDKFAYVANIGSGTVSVIDVQGRTLLKNIKTGEGAEGIAVTPDGAELWVSNRADNTISIVDTKSLRVTETLPSADFPIRIEIRGPYALVTNAKSGDLAVFKRKTREEIQRFKLADEDSSMFSRFFRYGGSTPIGVITDDKHAYVALAGGDRVAVVDPRTWKVLDYWKTGAEPDAMAIASGPDKEERPSWVGRPIEKIIGSEKDSPEIYRRPGELRYTWRKNGCERNAIVNNDGIVKSVFFNGCDFE